MKIYLRLGYNNMKIKEIDEWKTVFYILEGTYKPIIIFF